VPNDATARQLADRLGVDDIDRVSALKPGLGGTDLWRLHRPAGDLVLRAFPAAWPMEVAQREAAAHELARANGVSAPAVFGCEQVDGRPVLMIEWADGDLLADLLWAGRPADDIGRRCGALLAELHRIDNAPELITNRRWIDWAGDRAVELEPLLRGYPATSLLHLDFHPQNLIMNESVQLTVLDWANVRVGPPAADLARTLTILELIINAVPDVTDAGRQIVGRFRAGLLDGYRTAGGDPEVPDPMYAWAIAVQLDDLAGSWVPEAYFHRLRRRYAQLVTKATGRSHR
jgi:aminoglycoside phosphotransferase (APT) family kinase protein